MFAIFRCPGCGNLQGMELRHASVTCTSCSRRSKTDGNLVSGPFKTSDDMRSCLFDLGTSRMDEDEINLKDEMINRRSIGSAKGVLNKNDEEELILSLIEAGEDTDEALKRSLFDKDIGPDRIEEILNRLQKKNLLYSPRYNVYRKV